MFYDILDKKRLEVLPLLGEFKEDFYLAGGTALALQLGHRDSVDFDFFTDKNIDTNKLFKKVKKVFKGRTIKKIQEEKNTLTVIIDDNIKISFFTYNYPLLEVFVIEKHLKLASILDISCMKLSAIISRSTLKDYVDLYFVLQELKLTQLLEGVVRKFSSIDYNLILKSLVYFDDIIDEPIIFKNNKSVSKGELEDFFEKIVLENR